MYNSFDTLLHHMKEYRCAMSITEFKLIFEERFGTISFGEESFEFEVGDLSLLLISTSDHLITHILQCFRNQREILIETFDIETKNDTQLEQRSVNHTKNKIFSYFIECVNTEYKKIDNSRIGDLFFHFPLAEILMGYRIHYGYKSIAERRPSYITYKNLSTKEFVKSIYIDCSNELKNNPQEIFKDVLGLNKKPPTTYNELVYRATDYIALSLFKKKSKLTLLENQDIFLDAAIGYCDSIINNLLKIRQINPQLREFIDNRKDIDFKTDDLPTWLMLELNTAKNPDIPLSLTAVITLEQEYLFKQKKYIRVCPICNRLFIAHVRTSKYCSEPNLKYNGRICQEIGKNEGPASKMKLHPFFNNKRKSYCNWKKKQYDKHLDIFKSSQASTIKSQLDFNYKEWTKNALSAVYKYENNNINLEEAEALINLPEVEFRSPLLYKLLHK